MLARPKAFTLIELLTTVAIIGILAALLLTTLSRSKHSAQRIRCVGNLRQLGLAGQMYWDDHNGQAFRYYHYPTNGGHLYWFGWLSSGAEGDRIFEEKAGALHPYLRGRGIETCPSFAYVNSTVKLKATGASYGYGYNLLLGNPREANPVNVQLLVAPSEVVFLADAAQVNTFQFPASPDRPMIEEFYYVSTNESTAHFRHIKSAQAVHCDGHVANYSATKADLDLRVRGQFIGKLPTTNLTPR
jgi:prepilin-type N-terminal cleavage/methylation domain-containing protein